jgi:hypothetical protein
LSQRNSGYPRQLNEAYDTPVAPILALVPFLRARGAAHVWDAAAGAGNIVRTLSGQGFIVTGTTADFFTETVPTGVDTIVTNPPFGTRGRLAVRFIERAVELMSIVAMLLRVDFDSAKTCTHLFRDNPLFAQKLTLLNRIVWFQREHHDSPSENHAWFVWDRRHHGPPTIAYAGSGELKSPFDEILRGLMDAQQRILSASAADIAPGDSTPAEGS